ncbi:hypothetical protein LUZ60_008068 [Juncus effusus]|nr:hypothetical protein LUZ60_008068 [Juncus effusus]
MASQQGVKLAAKLVSSHFGDLVAKVCECLLKHGTLSLQDIIRFTEMIQSHVKNCLLVLIQHNCVQAFSIPRSETSDKTITQYTAIFDNIICRMRFPKFLSIVKDDLGNEAEALFEGLVQNGRLTFEQIVERSISKDQHKDQGDASTRACFNKLVNSHYVERCPKSEPFIDIYSEDQPKPTKRRGAKAVEIPLSLEQQAIEASFLVDSERFCEIPDSSVLEESRVNNSPISGQKRKHEDKDEDLETLISESEVLWRVNYDKLLWCLKKNICSENVRSTLDNDGAIVLESLMEVSGQQKVKDNNIKASFNRILERVREKPGGVTMTMDHLRTILELLKCDTFNENLDVYYSLDLNWIIENCQNDEVELFAKARYGKEAYRIFRLLITRGKFVDTDEIAEITFTQKADAHQTLYKLWKDEYIESLRVQPHGSTRENATLFWWKLDRKSFYKHVLDDTFHAALNLTEKISQIIQQLHEVSEFDARVQLNKRRAILQLSLLKIDDSIMFFHDFINHSRSSQ